MPRSAQMQTGQRQDAGDWLLMPRQFRQRRIPQRHVRDQIRQGIRVRPLSRLRDDGYVDVHENRWKLTNLRAKTANNPNFVGRQMSSALHDHMNEAPPGDDPDSAPESPDVGK